MRGVVLKVDGADCLPAVGTADGKHVYMIRTLPSALLPQHHALCVPFSRPHVCSAPAVSCVNCLSP